MIDKHACATTQPFLKMLQAIRIVMCLLLAAIAPREAAAQGWTTLAPLPLARYEAPSVALNGKIYAFGGFVDASLNATAQVHVYTAAADTWTYLTDIPTPAGMPTGLTHHGIALDDDRFVWIAGGFAGVNGGPVVANVWKYNLAANTWSAGPSLPAARGGGALVKLGRELHYVGGTMANRNTDAGDHWVLNLDQASPSWVSAAPLPTPRTHFSAVALNGKIYAIAGQHNHDIGPSLLSVVEVYDPATNTWTAAASTPVARAHFEPGTFVRDGRIVIVGGNSNNGELSDITEYDPLTNAWTALTPALPAGSRAPIAKAIGSRIVVAGGSGTTCCAATTSTYATTLPSTNGSWSSLAPLPSGRAEIGVTAARGKVYVLAGNANGTLVTTVSVYDPSSNTWSDIAPVPGPARDHVGAVTVDDKVYAIGGLTGWPGPSVASVYMYDPLNAAAGWVTKASLPIARGAAGVGAINGKIYVVGGLAGSVAVNHLTVYDPLTNTWTTLAPMAIVRDHLTAAVVDGRLYAIGGRNTTITATTTATAVYDPATNTWTNLAPMLAPRGSLESGVLGGRIYVYGADTGSTALAANEEFDPATNAWRPVTPMITARSSSGGAVISGRIFAPGGKGTDGGHNLTVNEAFTLGGGGAGNQPPVVNAGLDKGVILPTTSVDLTATATDDGLPGPLTFTWSAVAGPAGVTFSSPASPATTAIFPGEGTYTLRFTASDSVLSSADDVVVVVSAPGSFAIRINAGGPAYTDAVGQLWAADQHFSGGGTYATAAPIAATVDDPLYQTERTGTGFGPGTAFAYNIPVPNGTYAVTLAFADIYWTGSGQRRFDVSIEGQQVITDLDIIATVGPKTALNLTFQAVVTDGTLTIDFVTIVDNAKVSAIQVIALGTSNAAPTISDVLSQSTPVNAPTGAIAFAVGDAETAVDSLIVTGATSNPTLVPAGNIVFGGSGAARTVTVTPAPNQTGTATITLTVSDWVLTTSDTFALTVTPTSNTAPTISDVTNRETAEDTGTGAIAFTVGDSQTAAGSLLVTGASSNLTLVPVGNLVFGGSGAARTVTVTPAPNQAGTATITLTVSDGALTASDTFLLTVSAVNDAPTISSVVNQVTGVGAAVGPLTLTVGDIDTTVGSLTLSGSTSNATLVPAGSIVFGGTGASRTVTVTPAAGQTGTATITMTVTDGQAIGSSSFLLTVSATPVGLAAAWGFNEGAGSTVGDASGNGQTGTIANATWTDGHTGAAALAFNGSNAFVSTPSTVAKTASSFTLSAWFKTNTTIGAHHLLWEGTAGSNGFGEPVNSPASAEMGLTVGSYNQNNKIAFFLGYDVPTNGKGANPIYIVSTSNFTDTTSWHHVAVTVMNLGNGSFSGSLYVDGVLKGTDTGVQNDRSQWGSMVIGKPGASSRYFNGNIDAVRIYSRALSLAEILTDMTTP
jgi:N-acetylneuraminic acid mutarotase